MKQIFVWNHILELLPCVLTLPAIFTMARAILHMKKIKETPAILPLLLITSVCCGFVVIQMSWLTLIATKDPKYIVLFVYLRTSIAFLLMIGCIALGRWVLSITGVKRGD